MPNLDVDDLSAGIFELDNWMWTTGMLLLKHGFYENHYVSVYAQGDSQVRALLAPEL